MSSRDDPFGDGKTVISRPRSAERRAVNLQVPAPGPQRPEATVFDPGFAGRQVTGWNEPPIGLASAGPKGAGDGARPEWRSLVEASRRITYRSANPLVAAAGPLLILLGQLRHSPAYDIEPATLANHLAQLIEDFELTLTRGGVNESDARVARYLLCETADDIAQTLPDFGAETWMPIGMLSRFFRADAAGSGFFDALNRVLGNPEPHCDLIELMHACLALGFEGQYRGMENGSAVLARVRKDVHQVLRYFRPASRQGLSPRWQPVMLTGRRRRPVAPVWAVAAAGCALVAGAFVEIRDRITREGEAVASEILSLTPSTPASIEHVAFVPVLPKGGPPPVGEVAADPSPEAPSAEVAPTSPSKSDVQLERVRAALAEPIETGKLKVDTKGKFIIVEINNQQLFLPGKAALKPEFQALVGPLAKALSAERGPVKVVGHTDGDKPGRTSTFKSNYDLSVARAKAVENLLAGKLDGKPVLEVEGRGEDEPVADNKTPEGKAKNRRVDLLIAREEGS